MSIIQQLRDKAAILLTSLIALSLIGFLVQDAFIGRSSGVFSGRTESVGTINGRSVDAIEFNSKVNMAEQGYRSQGVQTNEMMTQNIIESIWNGYIQDELVRSEAAKLGLSLTSKELGNLLFSDNAPQEFKQLFTDPNTGIYDLNAARSWFNNLKKSKKPEDLKMVNEQLINPLHTKLLTDKYTSLFTQGTYVPKWMVEKTNADNSNFASLSFVSVPYATISDSLATLKVTDAEINEYVQKHKEEFKQDKTRSISYVVFDANPSAADTAALYNQLLKLKSEMAEATDARAFVTRNNSNLPFFDGYALKSRLQMSAKDTIAAMPVGSVIGPYLDANALVIARKIDVKRMPDSVKCRHILVGTIEPRSGQMIRSDSVAKKKADSIYNAIQTGSDFGVLAAALSDDQGSKSNRGEYDFSSVDLGTLAKEFGEFIFNKAPGTREVVKTQFGYHILEVLNQRNFEDAYKMAYLSKRIVASEETDNTASAAATQFAGNSRDPKEFEANVVKSGYNKRIAENVREMDYSVDGMPSRALVKWIYENKVGAVSEPFDMKDRYLVVQITGAYNEGVQPASIARTMVEPILRNKKKAAEIAKKIGSATTLEAVASANNAQVMMADTVRFADPFVPNLGSEPRVIGAAFNKNYQTKVSEPIEGNTGVFVIKVNQVGALSSASADVSLQKRSQEMQLKQYANYSTLDALRKAADIKDTRREAGY
jgi:peptidyl-prolyl cis-trans isomerase D